MTVTAIMISRERHRSYYTSKRDKIYCACASFIRGNASSVTRISVKLPLTYLVNKFLCLLPPNASDGADFLIVESDTIELVCGDKHFWPESSRDELSGCGKLVDHPGDGCPVLCIQIGIDLKITVRVLPKCTHGLHIRTSSNR